MRHGESHANAMGIYGSFEDPLTRKGVLQAQRTSKLLIKTKLSGIYSSPVKRAYDTAGIIAKEHNMTVKVNKAFVEPGVGAAVGEKHLYIPSVHRSFYAEKVEDMQAKIANAANKIAKKHSGDVLIVSHATPIRLLIYYYIDKKLTKSSNHTLSIGTGSLSIISFEHRVPTLLISNYPDGLQGL